MKKIILVLCMTLAFIGLKAQTICQCPSPANSCNIISNGDFEIGLPPTGPFGIRLCNADCWWASSVYGNYSLLNDPDVFDTHATFASNVSIPNNFRGNTPIRLGGYGDRYGGIYDGETMAVKLNSSLQAKVYFLEFYYAYGNLFLPTPGYERTFECAIFKSGSSIPIVIPLKPFQNVSGNKVKLMINGGQWTKQVYCLDLSDIDPVNWNGYDAIAFNYSYDPPFGWPVTPPQNSAIYVDDFVMKEFPYAGDNQTVCEDQQLKLGPTCPDLNTGGPTTFIYEWRELGSSTILSTALNYTFTANHTATYNLTVKLQNPYPPYTTNSCVVSSNVTVTVVPQPNVTITGSSTACQLGTYSVPPQPNVTFTWTFKDISVVPTLITTLTGNSVSPPAGFGGGTVSVTGNVAISGTSTICSNTSADYDITPCCAPIIDEIFINKLVTSYTSGWANKNIIIKGVFTINTSVTINKCHFYMAPGSSIVVDPGVTFTLTECIIEGCPTVWNGISLNGTPGNITTFNCTSSIIQNALNAVICNPFSTYLIDQSVFNQNNRGLLINGPSNGTITTRKITGSIFTCRKITPLPAISNLPAFAFNLKSNNLAGYSPSSLVHIPTTANPNARGEAGVDINFVGASSSAPVYNLNIGDVGAYSSTGNLFDSQNYGIKIRNSNVEVVNCRFQEMHGYDYPKFSTGIGIWATADAPYSLKIGGGAVVNESNTFVDCGIGNLINNYRNVLIKNNSFQKMVGSGASSCCTNYSGHFGIKLTSSVESFYTCESNTITNINTGIEYAQNNSKLLQCIFNGNIITTNSNEICYVAIFVHGPGFINKPTSYINIDNNDITNVWNGIKVQDFLWDDNALTTVKQNTRIHILRKGLAPQYGIYILNSKYVEIVGNRHIKGLTSGFSWNNITGIYIYDSPSSKVDCNTVEDMGECVGFRGYCHTPDPNGVLHRNIFINYRVAVDILPMTQIGAQGTWVNASDNEWQTSGAGRIDIKNMSGTAITFNIQNSGNFIPINNFPLGQVLLSSPSGISPSIACQGFSFSPTNVLGAEELSFIRKLSRDGIVFPLLAAETKWHYGHLFYEALKKDTTINPNDTIIGNFIDSLENGNIGMFHIVGASINNVDWNQAESVNQSISYQNHMEENLKKLNGYYIAYYKDTTIGNDSNWISSMINNLTPIAEECISTGGPAVSLSRTMLSCFSNQLLTDNEECLNYPTDTIVSDSNSTCAFVKGYSVPVTSGATYNWTVPAGASFTQTGNSVAVNWGNLFLNGGTITCLVMDAYGNSSYATYTESAINTTPTCVTATANSTSCVSATSLSWSPPPGCAAGYTIWLGTNGGGTVTPNNVIGGWDVGNVTYVMLPILSPGTTYYYQVIPYNNSYAPVTGCSIFSFTSGSSVSFTPSLGNPYIENFDGVSPPELPCGITISDENFPRDGVVWATSTAASCSGNNSIAISKNPNNTTAKDDWFYSVPLNLTAGELYQVDFNAKTDGPQTEGIEAYIGSSPDAATMQSTSSIINSYLSNSNCVNTLASDYIAAYTGQFYVGVHANGSPNSQTLFVDDLRVSLIPTVKISAETCGDTVSSCERIQCDLITGATSYKFRIENLQLGFSMDYTVNSNNPLLSEFYNAPVLPLPLGETYTVSATAFVNGNWMPFGASCTITINAQTSVTASDVSGCTGSAISLYGSPSGGTFSLSNPYTGPSASYTYTFTDEYGCAVTSIPANITVNALPTVSAANVSGCEGTAISLSGSPAGGTWSVANPYTGASATYTHSYTDANGCNNTSASATITVTACPKLNTTTCNTASFNMCDRLAITTVSGATAYKYKFENSSLGFSQEYTPASLSYNPYLYQFLNATSTSIIPGNTYAVSVAALVNGSWTYYGPACNVVVNPIPITSLNSASCNINLPSMNTYFYTNNTGICGIYDYKYEFTEGNTTFEVNRGLTLNNFIMIWIPSPNLAKYSTTYSVRVKLKMGNTWGDYGPSCTITTPSSPLTQLQTAFCGYTLPLFSSLVNCDAVPGAIDYRYHITGPSNYNKTFNRNQAGNDWHFSWTILGSGQQNMVPNTTYAVEVASNAGGVWSAYGASCNITTPATQWREAEAFELNQNAALNEATDELALLVYPNPNAINNEFFIEVRGIHSAGEVAQITIYDLVGKLIYKETATYNEGDTQLRVKPSVRPAQGVYLIEAIVKGKKLRQKFVVD